MASLRKFPLAFGTTLRLNSCKQKKCKHINYVKSLQLYLKRVFNIHVKNVCNNKAFIN
jgi:hypothetical protein